MIDHEMTEVSAGRRPTRDWQKAYASRLVFTDLLVLIWVVYGVQIAWFGFDTENVEFRGNAPDLALGYTTVSVIIIIGWMAMLGIYGTRGYRVLGTGPEEYRLIADTSLRLFGLLAIVAYLFHIDLARGYILIAFPLGLMVLVLSRWMWRQWLGVQRQRGRYSSTVLLVGSAASAAHLARELARHPEAGYLVVGACIPSGVVADYLPGTQVPVLGGFDRLHAGMALAEADTVVVTGSDELPSELIRELSWSLEPERQHLVVAPSLTDIGGPRIHLRPVAGLPLIHVETPRYEGRTLFTKRLFDVCISGTLILLFAPLLAFIALAVRFTSPGPVLFSQERVGLDGGHFRMLKFRSMVVGAEALLANLREQQRSEGNAVMFKMANDPRVTRIGRVLRRFSLDELPQLFNVFVGSMSIVGPRPPLVGEVDEYESRVHRRFMVKPGITGLWQVSGRSHLSWEDTVRLDLYYVENWSLAGDLVIVLRTFKAVLGRVGAY